MVLIICVSDFFKDKTFYEIKPSQDAKISNNRTNYNIKLLHTVKSEKCENAKLPANFHVKKRLRWDIDGINFFYLRKELLNFLVYRSILYTKLNQKGIQILRLQIVQPQKEIIDWKWNHMLSTMLWEKIEIENLLSWLSTLGGAYSALGEKYSKCAEIAGNISEKQLIIGIKLGDPLLQCRCKLFYSISLIQMGRLRSAKYIIREQYKFARRNEQFDGRLVKMCKGIWLKLKYEYELRLEARKKEKYSKSRK